MPCVSGAGLQRFSIIADEALQTAFTFSAVPNCFSALRDANAIALLQSILSVTFNPPRKLRRSVNSKRILPVIDP